VLAGDLQGLELRREDARDRQRQLRRRRREDGELAEDPPDADLGGFRRAALDRLDRSPDFLASQQAPSVRRSHIGVFRPIDGLVGACLTTRCDS